MTLTAKVALATWRIVWRHPYTRLAVAALAIVTLAAAITTSGVPTSGDAAVQMYALAYAVVPFLLVLAIGELGQEHHTWDIIKRTSPSSREQLLVGQFLGSIAVGLATVLIMAVWGWALMTLIAHANVRDGALWTLQFALFTMPSVVTLAGGALWLATALGGRTKRYGILATFIGLALAVAEYNISRFFSIAPHLPFFNPFPGFLEWGVALPPPLIAPPGISGWLWVNRLLWGLAGILLVLLALRRPDPRQPLKHPRTIGFMAVLTAAGIVAASAWSDLDARHLSPPIAAGQTAVTNFTCQASYSKLFVNASNGRMRVLVSCTPSKKGTLRFAMNAGLTVQSIKDAGHTLSARRSGVIPGTALREWTVVGAQARGGMSVLATGRVLPYPSTLPYPPFAASHLYSGIFAGSGHAYIADAERDLPTFLAKASPVQVRLARLAPGTMLTNAAKHAKTRVWTSTLGQLAVSTGHLYKLKGGPNIWVVPRRGHLPQFLPYVGSLRQLEAWLPLARNIAFVPSPVTMYAEWRPPFILYSEVHPFALPRDPISGSAEPPTSYTATLTLSRLFWAAAAPHQDTPAHVVLTALLIFSHSNVANQTLLLQEMHQGLVTDLGPIDKRQVHAVLKDWHIMQHRSRHAQRLWLRAVYRGRKGLHPPG